VLEWLERAFAGCQRTARFVPGDLPDTRSGFARRSARVYPIAANGLSVRIRARPSNFALPVLSEPGAGPYQAGEPNGPPEVSC